MSVGIGVLAVALALAPVYELRYYRPGEATPVQPPTVIAVTCGVSEVTATSQDAINPTRHVFADGDRGLCEAKSAESLSALPTTPIGALYEGTVARCESGGCVESARAEFCVGVPTAFAVAASCREALTNAYVAVWIYCVLLRQCSV